MSNTGSMQWYLKDIIPNPAIEAIVGPAGAAFLRH